MEEGEAFDAGQMMNIKSQRMRSILDDVLRQMEHAIGLSDEAYTINDSIEGTNEAVGVKEEDALGYKPTDPLPPNVRRVDISGATSVSLSVRGDRGELEILNAD